MLIVNKLGGAGDWFGDYLCVDQTKFPFVSAQNQFPNTHFTRPLTKFRSLLIAPLERQDHDPRPVMGVSAVGGPVQAPTQTAPASPTDDRFKSSQSRLRLPRPSRPTTDRPMPFPQVPVELGRSRVWQWRRAIPLLGEEYESRYMTGLSSVC